VIATSTYNRPWLRRVLRQSTRRGDELADGGSTPFRGEKDTNGEGGWREPRKAFFYWSDDGDLMALRFEQWKVHFMEQRAHGLGVWREPLVSLRVPKIFNVRSDPFERGDQDASMFFTTSGWPIALSCWSPPRRWSASSSRRSEFPPRQKPASFSIDQALERARERQKAMTAAPPPEAIATEPAGEQPAAH
jgi:hypothetical protein